MDIDLTAYQRINLLNQYTILQKLSLLQGDKDEAEFYEQKAKIISNGYTHEYNLILDCLFEEFGRNDAQLVWDTLEMYSAIYYSYRNIENPELTYEQITFPGFDGNSETTHMFYCKFILFDMRRYTEFLENGRTDFNSHSEKCGKYCAMLTKWKEMNKPLKMTEEQIKELINTH